MGYKHTEYRCQIAKKLINRDVQVLEKFDHEWPTSKNDVGTLLEEEHESNDEIEVLVGNREMKMNMKIKRLDYGEKEQLQVRRKTL